MSYAAVAKQQPIVIYRSVNMDGETFALEPASLSRLRARFPDLRVNTRVFIGHETRADFEHIHGNIVPQVVALLAGVSLERLHEDGFQVTFVDPATDRALLTTSP